MKITYQQFIEDSKKLAKKIKSKYKAVYGIPTGGLIPAFVISQELNLPLIEKPDNDTLVVDDLIDSGRTISRFGNDVAVLYRKPHSPFCRYWLKEVEGWIDLPHEELKKGLEDHIVRILEYIGENPNREGLRETPKRVVRMYDEIFHGLKESPPDFKLFESKNDQMIVKTFDCYSWCEHHLVPIEMKIAFGYIPNGKVTGISKIIRRIKWWAARPIIQENFTEWIVDDFMQNLNPQGVMLIVKGRHFCELIRGVKTESWTITSAIRGNFRNFETRQEFLNLVK